MLLVDFAGRTLRMNDVFELHHVARRYISRNYKAALLQLEREGKIVADPPMGKRCKGSFSDRIKVTFPNR